MGAAERALGAAAVDRGSPAVAGPQPPMEREARMIAPAPAAGRARRPESTVHPGGLI